MRVCVQHHPARAVDPAILREWPRARVIPDPEPDGPPTGWRSYRACLAAAGSASCLIIQDDAVPFPGARIAAERAARARPGSAVALWVGPLLRAHADAIRAAGDEGCCFAELRRDPWVPIVAMIWPAGAAIRALAATRPDDPRADDAIIGSVLERLGISVYATVPSLVEHPDASPSLIAPHRRVLGWRSGVCPPPAECDLRAIDWSEPSWR